MGGYAADVVALAVELAGPIRAKRVSMPDIPIPFSAPLEDWARPSAAKVAAAARELAAA